MRRTSTNYIFQPRAIRRMLTDGAVCAADKRAQFIGIKAYVEAGGAVQNDLRQSDPAARSRTRPLLDMLIAKSISYCDCWALARGLAN